MISSLLPSILLLVIVTQLTRLWLQQDAPQRPLRHWWLWDVALLACLLLGLVVWR